MRDILVPPWRLGRNLMYWAMITIGVYLYATMTWVGAGELVDQWSPPMMFLQFFFFLAFLTLFLAGYTLYCRPLERFFPVSNLPGVTLGARVTANRRICIVLQDRASEREGIIPCIHSIVAVTADPARGLNGFHWRRKPKIARLDPREHFKALYSFVGFIAEEGLSKFLSKTPVVEHDFGFDAIMRSHFLQAARQVGGACNVLLFNALAELLETEPSEWLQSRIEMLAGEFNLRGLLNTPHYKNYLLDHQLVQAWFQEQADRDAKTVPSITIDKDPRKSREGERW